MGQEGGEGRERGEEKREEKGKVQIEAGWQTMLPQSLPGSTLLPVNSSELYHPQPLSTYSHHYTHNLKYILLYIALYPGRVGGETAWY